MSERTPQRSARSRRGPSSSSSSKYGFRFGASSSSAPTSGFALRVFPIRNAIQPMTTTRKTTNAIVCWVVAANSIRSVLRAAAGAVRPLGLLTSGVGADGGALDLDAGVDDDRAIGRD